MLQSALSLGQLTLKQPESSRIAYAAMHCTAINTSQSDTGVETALPIKRLRRLLRRAMDDVRSQTAAQQACGVCMLPEAEQLQSVRDVGSAKSSGA